MDDAERVDGEPLPSSATLTSDDGEWEEDNDGDIYDHRNAWLRHAMEDEAEDDEDYDDYGQRADAVAIDYRPVVAAIRAAREASAWNALHLFRAARRDVPPEVVELIVDAATDYAGGLLCDCQAAPPHGPEAVRWLKQRYADDSVASFVVCCGCGKCRALSANVDAQSACTVRRQMSWLQNPHFHVGTGAPRHVAERHRASRWHNFRGMVADEWVVSGSATYRVQVLALFAAEFALGVVRRGCAVNSLNDWVPGYEAESAALVCGPQQLLGRWDAAADVSPPGLYSKFACAACVHDSAPRGRRAACESCKSTGIASHHCCVPGLQVKPGDVLDVRVDVQASMCAFTLNGAPLGTIRAPPGPLALVVGLMYARDSVAVTRMP
ncbi:hypothetical protein M885DRAFT_584170 [Pelagophyceae sp. CCMP2097]|nr:hypothetical protein M885DRAFT_584170 [Pelagophyceae sp. CCMP2097]